MRSEDARIRGMQQHQYYQNQKEQKMFRESRVVMMNSTSNGRKRGTAMTRAVVGSG